MTKNCEILHVAACRYTFEEMRGCVFETHARVANQACAGQKRWRGRGITKINGERKISRIS